MSTDTRIPPRFRLVETLPGGHRLFHDAHRPGMLAIADSSGSTPDRTDDGVLWINTTAPIQVGARGNVLVALVEPDGTATHTIVTAADAFVLSDITGQEIEVFGTIYRVAKVTA